MRPVHRYVVLMTICLCALIGPAGGCAMVGLVASKVTPPAKTPAQFALGSASTIVIVEHAANPSLTELDAQQIAGEITEELKREKAGTLLSPSLVAAHRDLQPLDSPRSRPAELARACGADQLIYVDLTKYTTTSAVAGTTVEGRIEAAVWVVDVPTASVRWPVEANQGYPLAVAMPPAPTVDDRAALKVRREMNSKVAVQIAKLFHVWTEE